MNRSPFSNFGHPQREPLPVRPRIPTSPGTLPSGVKTVNCRPLRQTAPRHLQTNGIQVVDHRELRMQAERGDRRRDTLEIPTTTFSTQSDQENRDFSENILPESEEKMVDVWVTPEECLDIFVNKRSGIEIRNCKVIGINGRQWALLPGNNRVPWIVMEALETGRELRSRYKSKLVPGVNSGRKVSFTDPRSTGNRQGTNMLTNFNVFRQDSMLGQPGILDGSVNSNVNNLIHQHKEQYFKTLKQKG